MPVFADANPIPFVRKYHYDSFSLDSVLKLKQSAGYSVALGVPVLNEGNTLKKTLTSLKEYRDLYPLIDEIKVFDSGSTDLSRSITLDEGLEFITDSALAERLNLKKNSDWISGKGFNMWASLYFFSDYDIVMWMDADINILPRYVYGILGPLFDDNNIQFVKGTYHRDMGDSRVTSYTVDPVLGLLFPEANGFMDPLCGLFAGRYSHFQNIPFTTGYSVEIVTLIHSIMALNGSALAEVDIGTLENRRHPDNYMSKMSFSITDAILRLAAKYGKLSDLTISSSAVQRDCSEMVTIPITDFTDITLPPMNYYLN